MGFKTCMLLVRVLYCGLKKKKVINYFHRKDKCMKILVTVWDDSSMVLYFEKLPKNTVWITSDALKCLVLCLQIAPWHEMCFAAVIKVHQSLGWGKIQTVGQKKSWVQIVDLPRVRWSQILFALHCLTEALSKNYKQAKFTACINKLNVTEVSCLHWQWICLPGFKWLLHPLMSEHKTNFIMWSKLTNYMSFPSLTVEVGEKLLVLLLSTVGCFRATEVRRCNAYCLFTFDCSCLRGEKAAGDCLGWCVFLGCMHCADPQKGLRGLCPGLHYLDTFQGSFLWREVALEGWGQWPNVRRRYWQIPQGGQTGEQNSQRRLQQVRWGTALIPIFLTGLDLGPLLMLLTTCICIIRPRSALSTYADQSHSYFELTAVRLALIFLVFQPCLVSGWCWEPAWGLGLGLTRSSVAATCTSIPSLSCSFPTPLQALRCVNREITHN